MDNEATLSGIIASEPIFSHCIHETRLYTCEICVKRLSDTADRIVLLAPEALCSNLTGEVTVHGQLRGYTRQDADKRRLILMVLVRKVTPGLAAENNRIALSGTLVREVGYRKTPLGREIADLMLRVPRPYAGTDYVPCVVWGRCARFCTHLQKDAEPGIHQADRRRCAQAHGLRAVHRQIDRVGRRGKLNGFIGGAHGMKPCALFAGRKGRSEVLLCESAEM